MARLGSQAVVIGGSIAGLLAARALADHFDAVTVLERDSLSPGPGPRRSVPQAAHVHGLLRGGEQAMSALFPDFAAQLREAGAVALRVGCDIAYHLPDGKAYSPGGAVRQPRDLGFDVYGASRGLIEHSLRQRALAVPGVRLVTGTAVGLACEDGHVTGVRCQHEGTHLVLPCDLAVDAAGRGSRAQQWLGALDFAEAPETLVGIDMTYASARFRLPAADAEPERQIIFRGAAPAHRRSAILGRIEDGSWHLTLAGRLGECPPYDEAGFRAFAAGVPSPALQALLAGGERLGEIAHYAFPASIWRHYERVAVLPQRWLAVGDAVASFNPVYGQGMAVAALHAQALQGVLARRAAEGEGLEGAGREFFGAASAATAHAWWMAAGQDFDFPGTRGQRPQGWQERAAYAAALDALLPEDPALHRLLVDVANLTAPLSALRQEPLQSRVRERMRLAAAPAL